MTEMEVEPQVASGGADSSAGYTGESGALTPDLVRQVADRVFAMIIEELHIEQERQRFEKSGWRGKVGGDGYGNID
jgi:hypothetical protein